MLGILLIILLWRYVETGVIILQTTSQEDRDPHVICFQFLQATLPCTPDLVECQIAVELHAETTGDIAGYDTVKLTSMILTSTTI